MLPYFESYKDSNRFRFPSFISQFFLFLAVMSSPPACIRELI